MSVNRTKLSASSFRRQNGAALVVALIILATVTLIGVSNMESSNLEMKMVASTLDRSEAFSAVESALSYFESEELPNRVDDLDDLFTDVCDQADECFDPDCGGGFCFEGDFNLGMVDPVNDCTLDPLPVLSLAQPSRFWLDQAGVWDVAGNHLSVERRIAGDVFDVKGIIEFMCFDEVDTRPVFRVTAYYDGESRTPVMLQSTFVVEL